MVPPLENFEDYPDKRPYWKKIWQVTCGSLKNIATDEIEQLLHIHKDYIINGILLYSPGFQCGDRGVEVSKDTTTPRNKDPTKPRQGRKSVGFAGPESDKLESSITEKSISTNVNFEKFITRLKAYLQLDRNATWRVLTSYIMYDYCGSLNSLYQLKYEMHIVPLLYNIWKFHTSERMFQLKIVRTCLEFMDMAEHPYSLVYKKFIYEIGTRNLWMVLLEQFKYLLSEIKRSALQGETPNKCWVERNTREQIEILQCLILLANFADITLSDFDEIFKIFKSHGFGKHPAYYECLTYLDESSIAQIKYAEFGVILCMADYFWSQEGKWYEHPNKIDDDMQLLINSVEHSPIVYIWVIMHMVLPNSAELYTMKYNFWLDHILGNKLFVSFENLVRHEMFSHNTVVGVNVRQALYHLLLITHEKFNQEDSLLTHPGLLGLLAEILKTPHITEQFYALREGGLLDLWIFNMNLLPYKFYTVATLAEAIISASPTHLDLFMKQIERMPFYIVAPNPNEDPAERMLPAYTRELALFDDLKSSSESNTSIDCTYNWTVVKYRNINLVKYMSYSNLFWEIFDMLNSALAAGFDFSSNMDDLVAGLKLTIVVLQQDSEAYTKYPYFHKIFKACVIMFVKCSGESKPPYYLLSLCMDIITEILPMHRREVLSKLLNHKLIPTILYANCTYVDMIAKGLLNNGIFGEMILNSQKSSEHYYLVRSYLNFLRTAIQTNKGDMTLMEMPGVLFVLTKVFPDFMSWFINQDLVIRDILYQSINIFYEMFQFTPEELSNDETRCKMHMATLCCLLDGPCSRVLLQLLVHGSNIVQYTMENETNWYKGDGVKYINTIQMILSLLMQLLKLRKKITIAEGPFPLVTYIYNANHNLKVIKAVANLIHHPYSNVMPILCVRLLRIFTLELKTSMLASLELEPDQLRMIFLQCLRDNFESEELKEAIIDFIIAGILTQAGLTEAFFTAIGSDESSNALTQQGLNENVGNFMVEFLMSATIDTAYLSSPLLYKVMEVFHSLWKTEKEMLIKDLIEDENFWPSLCYLLFQDITFDNSVYAQIFQIITREIHRQGGNINKHLKMVLDKFLSTKEEFIVKWVKHIFNHNITYEIEKEPSLLSAWEEFLIISSTFMEPTFINSDFKMLIASNCCTKLKDLILLQNNEAVAYCAQLYLFLIRHWGQIHSSENSEILYNDIITILSKTAASYGWLRQKLKEAILSIVEISFRSLKHISHRNSIPSRTLVDALVVLFAGEYQFLKNLGLKQRDCNFQKEDHNAYFTILNIINVLVTAEKSPLKDDYMKMLNESNIFKDIMFCASFCTRLGNSYEFSKCAIRTLALYVHAEESENFIDYDIAVSCFADFLPSKEFYKPPTLGTAEAIPPNLLIYWEMYEGLISVLYSAVKKYQHAVIKEVMMFVTLHEDYIKEILMLEMTCMDFHALRLTQLTLTFLYELIKYKQYWKNDHPTSFTSLVDTIKVTLASSTALIVRPNIIKYYTVNTTDKKATVAENVPEDNLVTLINATMNIIYSASSCLLLLSPPLINSVKDCNDYSNWGLILEIDFGLPKMGNSELTFGTLICISGLFVKMLQQISHEKKNKSTNVDATIPLQAKKGSTNIPAQFKNLNQSNIEIGFIRLDYLNPLCNLSTVHNFSFSTAVTVFPWYSKLDEITTSRTLESIMFLLASQIGPLLKYSQMQTHEIRYIRRELCSELQLFQDFVRKKLLDLYPYSRKHCTSLVRHLGKDMTRKDSSQKQAGTSSSTPDSSHSTTAPIKSLRKSDTEDKILYYKPACRNTSAPRKTSASSSNVPLDNISLTTFPDDFIHMLSAWFLHVLKTDNK